MNIKLIIYVICFVIFVHGICYFFNIDFMSLFDNNNHDDTINENIDDLQQSLEQLKEFS